MRGTSRVRKNQSKSERGATLVEFAMIFPAVLFIVFILVDIILYLIAAGTVERAAKQAAAYAAVVDGLESGDQNVIDDIKLQAQKLPGIALSQAFIKVELDSVQYVPPRKVKSDPASEINFKEYPLGVEISAQYRPLLPFLPTSIKTTAYAYRERSESSSLPVPLDCLGRPIIPGKPLPPIESCPCPDSADLLMRIDKDNPTQCKCVAGATIGQNGFCGCAAGSRYDSVVGNCKCQMSGSSIVDNECKCPDPKHIPTETSPGVFACVCPEPFKPHPNYPNSCVCLCGPNTIGPPNPNTCECPCAPNFEPDATGQCVCKHNKDECPPSEYFDQKLCACKKCENLKEVTADQLGCWCPLTQDPSICGGPEFVDAQACACKGICELPNERSTGPTSTTNGNCVCDREVLIQRCGSEANANFQFCNCKCSTPPCDCDLEALKKWCAAPRPEGQGGLPVWKDVCGCKSGKCEGELFELVDGICMCSPKAHEICNNDNRPIDPLTCGCKEYKCPNFLVNGKCACTPEALKEYCAKENLPVLDVKTCRCGVGCDPAFQDLTEDGRCVCKTDPCPQGLKRDPSTCRCECENGGVRKQCRNNDMFACFTSALCTAGSCDCTGVGDPIERGF